MSTIEKAMAKLRNANAPVEENQEASPQLLVEETANTDTASQSNNHEEPALEVSRDKEKAIAESPAIDRPEPTKLTEAQQSVMQTPAGEGLGAASQAAISTSASNVAQSFPATEASLDNQQTYVEIDQHFLKSKGFVTQESENRAMKEQFRSIKRKLLNNAFGPIASTLHYPNLIIITSCNPHEGKTFSSINLALNIALEQDKTVLLVDSDVVRPSVTRELGVKLEKGLTEYLSGAINNVSDIIYNTNIDNFKFIPAGKPHELSSELLASEKMNKLTQELATRYSDRVVIFDAPPLLGVNETHVMANLVGQAVIVVEENKTKLADIENAVSQLDKKLAIGFLVNKSRGSYRDYYGYGYYYNRDRK